MPPRPTLMLWPATPMLPKPWKAWICRFMAWMSAMAAKSRYLRQMKGARSCQDGVAGGEVAGDGPRLDERGALPVLADALVVVERRVGRDGKRRGAGIGPQPQIGAEHVAVAGALVEQADEIAGDAHEEGLRLEPGAQADAGKVVEDDEIDVGGVVELEGAVLAHGRARCSRQAHRRANRRPWRPGGRESPRRPPPPRRRLATGAASRSSPARRRPDRRAR